ncbi:MAG: N-acetyl-gamma-glutamyl-phosphate reductase [Bacteroidota bacterium]|nr:N-acetyl-gamma-glutamyl-phosphate reductase [Bacteroidota bacterium]MDP4214811.1 N-acetyl-gamma-glutamyl-phosphate reductase [Bacteroidota bacterium]MDP4246895.1 N-acetyl-gamma-glutamyl-phosphate reductase [Bacteroidota bacterium]MDP4259009.1 N-acetyl-gamma-glutamyl-phosphate reductase [Bacteroidota bacterium]
MAKIRAGIIGGAGYTGGEMIRILINHPGVEIAFVHSKSNAGKFLYEVHEDLAGDTDMRFDPEWTPEVDVLFLCVGHGEAKKFVDGHAAGFGNARIIDLSQDFRLHSNGQRPAIHGQPVIYGLPELNRDAIRAATHIANPGCFATTLQLGLLPLGHAGLLGEVHTTGITGSTGAGQGLSPTSHFSWRANNIQAYKTLTHQHLNEVTQSLRQLQPSFGGGEAGGGEAGAPAIHFVPWRGDFTRGIFISSQLTCDLPLADLTLLYADFYKGHPFTVISRSPISLKQVVNTNKCLIQLEKLGSRLVVHSAADNLLKGASGQAVQNMNLLFGLDETAGLHLKANAF